MRGFRISSYFLLLCGCLVLSAATQAAGFGDITIPKPATPKQAENCVAPTEIMRREHMKFLYKQRDRTVIDGERNGKYSLTGCMDCHNPVSATGDAPHYGDPDHFCSACHAYTSVKIDCFECHADRGYGTTRQNSASANAWDDGDKLTSVTLQRRLETDGGD
jgi:hypothetical protein